MQLTADLLAEIQTADEIARVQAWLDDFAFIESSKPMKPAIELVAARRGCSVSSINHKRAEVSEKGPLCLIDRRRNRSPLTPEAYGHRSPAFRKWVDSLYYAAKRNNATPHVHGQMITRLAMWRKDPTNPDLAIPGYATPPLDCAESRYKYPKGWSLRQLNDIKPDGYNRALGGTGRQAANLRLAPVLTTRVGLHVGEVYMFDDQYYDLQVHYGADLVRPVGLNAIDLFSGCDIARGIRPELPNNPDGEKSLCRRDMIWLVIQLLTGDGYYKKACSLVVEGGTATIGEEFQKMISLATDRVVQVSVGTPSREIVKGVFAPSRGNPRFKAARESWFNLLRNEMASLPLSLGRNRDEKPEDTDRLVSEEKALLKIAQKLPPSARANLQLEGLNWNRFLPIANHISEAINHRTDHDLEGFAAMGLERVEFCLDGTWISEDEYRDLSPEIRGLIVSRMHSGEIVSRPTKASPREVFESGRKDLKRISPFRWHQLVPHRYAIARTIPENRSIKIDRREYGPEPLHFEPVYYSEDAKRQALPAGKDVLIFLSPLQPDFALFTDTAGRPLGLVFVIQKVVRTDHDALLHQYGIREAVKAEIGYSAETYNRELGEERDARREHNKTILEAHGVKAPKTPKEKQKDKAGTSPKKRPIRATVISVEDLEILPPSPTQKAPRISTAEPVDDDGSIGIF